LGEKEAVPYLIKLSSDPDANVQLAAIRALGKIGGTAARKHVRECLNNPSEVIHQAAEQALDGLEIGEDPFSFQV
jgi:HEAT repeat protein